MNFEVYVPKYDKTERQKRQKLERESAEKEKKLEIQKTVAACAEYHKKLDGTGYFNSKAAKEAERLLPAFKAIKQNKLPECLKRVLTHRIAYLELMKDLGGNSKLMKLVDKYQPSSFNAGLFAKDIRNIQSSREYKELGQKDFETGYKIVISAISRLKELNKQRGGWGKDAERYLRAKGEKFQDSRVDDQPAARNLEKGLHTVATNFRSLQVVRRPRRSA
ncbi:hypothetical protein JW911_00245 [Candidatus Peregrinibacteria bacterium]|nr:hypothetical protein [Candidatus Peregrinibacteria bacterium]